MHFDLFKLKRAGQNGSTPAYPFNFLYRLNIAVKSVDSVHGITTTGQNEGDPSHPLEQLQESWRFFITFFNFFISIPHKTFKSIYLSLKLHSFYDFQF